MVFFSITCNITSKAYNYPAYNYPAYCTDIHLSFSFPILNKTIKQERKSLIKNANIQMGAMPADYLSKRRSSLIAPSEAETITGMVGVGGDKGDRGIPTNLPPPPSNGNSPAPPPPKRSVFNSAGVGGVMPPPRTDGSGTGSGPGSGPGSGTGISGKSDATSTSRNSMESLGSVGSEYTYADSQSQSEAGGSGKFTGFTGDYSDAFGNEDSTGKLRIE